MNGGRRSVFACAAAVASLIAAFGLAMAAPASAQTLRNSNCSDNKPAAGENLSEKLANSNGVLCPPDVDPKIKEPPPNAGRTPIIPPPGSPGGDPSVQPK